MGRVMSERSQRFKTKETAYIEVYGHAGVLTAELCNLSQTGAFLKLKKDDFIPRKGDLVNITVHLSSVSKSHNIDGEVIWTQDLGLGICFINKNEVLERMLAKASTF